MSIETMMPSKHLILCHPLLLLPLNFSRIRVFCSGLALHIRWPKYWSFSFSISSSNEYSRLMSFRTDWFDLFAIKGNHESSPVPQFEGICSSALNLTYGPTLTSTRKTIVLTLWSFVGKGISLLFNTLFRFPITILPTTKCLLILWLQSQSTVILELKKIKSVTNFHVFPIYLP